jgi:ArsR family transcriptional regulator
MPRKAEALTRPARDPDAGAAALLLALGHPLRLKLLRTIEEVGCCQCEMVELLGVHPVNISRHLAVLVRAGLVTITKEGTRTFPKPAHPEIHAILDLAERIVRRSARAQAHEARSLRAGPMPNSATTYPKRKDNDPR